jgi:sirohydrochlorin ferrochelatase
MTKESLMKLQKQFSPWLAVLLLSTPLLSVSAQRHDHPSKVKDPATVGSDGILLLAHGGSQSWNNKVNELAAEVNKDSPTEVAFGMANKSSIEQAVRRLTARGVRQIVAVPLFISSHSSVITSTEYLLALRQEAPPDLAIFARMDHAHGGGSHVVQDASFDPTTPIKSPVPIRMTSALDRHPLVAEILLARANSISQEPKREVVMIVAHGPVANEDNTKWLADMQSLADRMSGASSFRRIEYLTVRDDALEEVRAQATAELRKVVERATSEGNRVLVVPLLLSYGGIELGIKKRLEGLNYTMSPQGLLPDARLVEWVRLAALDKRRS